MAYCEKCERQVSDGWTCCAFCGRAVQGRVALDKKVCEHEFEIVGPHCILCGLKSGMGESSWVYWVKAVGAIFGGLFFLGLARSMADGPEGSPMSLGRIFALIVGLGLLGFGGWTVYREAGNVRIFRG